MHDLKFNITGLAIRRSTVQLLGLGSISFILRYASFKTFVWLWTRCFRRRGDILKQHTAKVFDCEKYTSLILDVFLKIHLIQICLLKYPRKLSLCFGSFFPYSSICPGCGGRNQLEAQKEGSYRMHWGQWSILFYLQFVIVLRLDLQPTSDW